MAFRTRNSSAAVSSTPKAIFEKTRVSRQDLQELWPHQESVLTAWTDKHQDASDVAIELPTGAGKTLIAGLIGEFERSVRGRRVTYLCPTKQLARQCHAQLLSYGLPAVLLIGPVTQWNSADRARYSSATAIAVSVGSHVFNSNPALVDSQYMIVDDAHAADSYVSSPWSINLERKETAYHEVLRVLADSFDPLVLNRLQQDTAAGQFASDVYLASPVGVMSAAAALEQVLKAAHGETEINTDAVYALKMLEGHLGHCLVYASYRNLQIRPFIPPTHAHTAFDSPKQRLYMSATLGEGGELERSFGRTKISRIPTPPEWAKRGTGRRFFMFPELTTDFARDKKDLAAWTVELTKQVGRAVVLTPDRRTGDDFEEWVGKSVSVLHAKDIEDDVSSFTSQQDVALVLTNRYDGLDLPDDDCRLVVIDGLPSRGDLQERFLVGSLGALDVLQERIRSRIVQGAGRATRNEDDYAAVLMLGDDLSSFCTRLDVRNAMRAELNAEVSFGLENSLGIDSDEMKDNFNAFLAQGDMWAEVESDLADRRDEATVVHPLGTAQLSAASKDEVAAFQAAWQGDWGRALEHARKVVDSLTGGRAPQRYASFWNYLAACWSLVLAEKQQDAGLRETSMDYYRACRSSGRGTLWMSYLHAPADHDFEIGTPAENVDAVDEVAAENILRSFAQVARPNSFANEVSRIRSQLLGTEATPYEEALVYLGVLAGAESDGNHGASSAPDASWTFSTKSWLGWEAKSEALPEGELGAKDVRQAGSHLRYIASSRGESAPSDSVVFLVTPQKRVHPSARAIAEDHVYLVTPQQVLEVFDALTKAWHALRARGSNVIAATDVLNALKDASALPSLWIPKLRKNPVKQ
jgi:hypothetical protein